jgi:hypothetical protein
METDLENELWRKAHDIAHTHCRKNAVDLEAAHAAGMLPVNCLIPGMTYIGHCRNASKAKYLGNGTFEYQRYKFGHTFPEEIKHPAFDEGFDVFVPVAIA